MTTAKKVGYDKYLMDNYEAKADEKRGKKQLEADDILTFEDIKEREG